MCGRAESRGGGERPKLRDDFESAFPGEHCVGLYRAGSTRVHKTGRANRFGGDIQIFARANELNHNLTSWDREGDGNGAERASFFRSDCKLATHVAICKILKTVGFFADLQLLSGADAEKLKIAERVSAEESLIFARYEQIRMGREPELHVARAELHRSVVDRDAFAQEMNFGHGLDELEFETRELIGGRINPCASFERNRMIVPGDYVGVNSAGTVRLLLKMNLPCRTA